MAIVVLVLWLFTAGAGFYLLVTGNLGHTRPVARPAPGSAAAPPEPAAASVAAPPEPAAASVAAPPEPAAASVAPAPSASAQAAPSRTASRREMRAARDRFAPPSLIAARNAPVVPGLRALLEFAHPACGLIGFAFWMGYTFVHYRLLGWIGFGLVAVTVALGLTWFAANTRAARSRPEGEHHAGSGRQPGDEHRGGSERPSFSGRLIALHGGAAVVTVILAALTALVLRA